jgi:hypothetical protein
MPWISNHSFTNAHTASRILAMVMSGPYYFSMSHTNRWSSLPPAPLPSDSLNPSELLVYKKAYEVMPAFRNPCGDKSLPSGYRGQEERWSLVAPQDIIKTPDGRYRPDITHLYISLLVEESDHTSTHTNILGLHSGVVLTKDANPGSNTYPPAMVEDTGTLHWLAYTSPIDRVPRLRNVVSFLIST